MSNNLFKGVVKLSQEQFDTLKSTGTLTVNGETITYSPDDTVYAVGDNISEQVSNNTSDIEQLQTDISSLETELTNKLDKNQGVENVGKFLGIDNTGDTLPLDLPKTGIIQLIGTEDNPVNLYTDTEIGQIYGVSGYVWREPNGTSNSAKFNTSVIYFRRLNDQVGIISDLILSSNGTSGNMGGTQISFNTNAESTDYVLGEIIVYNKYANLNINDSTGGNSIQNFYAPTTSGTAGQILQSNGYRNAPTWVDLEIGSGGTIITVGTEQVDTLTFTNDPQTQLNTLSNNKVDKEDGKGLSTNDYTTAEKDKLSGIEAGAQVNPTSLSELAEDSTHRLVTDAEKSTWNSKSDFSGSYNDLTDKPTIPTDNSQLTNGAGYVTNADVTSAVATKTAVNVNGMLQQTLNFDSDPQTQIDNLTNKGIAVYIDEGATSITQEQLEILQADDSNYIVYGQLVFYVSQIGPNNSIRFYINISSRSQVRYIYITSGGHLEVRNLDLPYILENNEITTTTTTQNVSSSTNNYVRLGNNLLIQWGHAYCGRDTNMTLTFGYPFADANYSIVVMNGDSSAWAAYLNGFKLEGSEGGGSGIGKTSTGCTITQYNYANNFEWIAIGRWE